MKEAACLQQVRLELPTWWLFEGSALLMLRRGSLRVVRVISQNKKHMALLRHSLCRCFSLEPMSQKTEIFARENKKRMKKTLCFQLSNLQNLQVTYKFMQVKARTSSATKI